MPQSDAAKEEADRMRRSALEYWKTYYDFYKHLMTIALTAIGVFGALLGGAFSDPSTWRGAPLVIPWLSLSLSRSHLIFMIFAGLIVGAIGGAFQARAARDYIYLLGRLETPEDLSQFHHQRKKARGFWSFLFVYVPFVVTIGGTIRFFVGCLLC